MDNKKTISIILAVLLVIALVALLIIERLNYQKGWDKNAKLYLVKDASAFYTVDDCVNRYITYIADDDTESLMSIINKDYARDYNLNSSNIINKLDNYNFKDNIISFEARKMYQERLSKSVIKYYVSGKAFIDDIDDMRELNNYYVIVTIDTDTLKFDVTPYDGKVFKENR